MPPPPAGAVLEGTVTPIFPLLLLETMRNMDLPPEMLEDEDLALSMPRRLGLSEVVGIQIRRFKEAVRTGRQQPVSEVENLVRLVIRRPDAEEIFLEAGRRVARHAWEKRNSLMRQAIRIMPRPFAVIAAHRAARRVFGPLAGGGDLRTSRSPLELRIEGSLTARADPGGAACSFYTGVLTEHLEIYTGRKYRVRHPKCEARGADACLWSVEVAS